MTGEVVCAHADTISTQQWSREGDDMTCVDAVQCLDCDAVLVATPKGTEESLLEQMQWLDAPGDSA